MTSPIRKTKIVATIGPASDDAETLQAMLMAGMNVARLNLSHGSYEEHRQRIQRIRRASEKLAKPVAVMVDTRGVEIRTGLITDGQTELHSGDTFNLYTDNRMGDSKGVSVTYQRLSQEVNIGDVILLDDGAMEIVVRSLGEHEIGCSVIVGGLLKENKGVNLPQTRLSMTAIEPAHRDDIVKELGFAAENEVDYIAASFIQSADELDQMRRMLYDRNAPIPIIAKIENRAGIENLEAIVAAADGIMVARGDMGVELPMADVPSMQKKIIRVTVSNGKPVITATQMLASMEKNPKPTRAEASDVANAILDGSSAVMLSGETAMGMYPVESVKTMDMLAIRTEASLREYGYLQHILPHPSNVITEAVSHGAVRMASQLKAAAIISLTESGFTSRLVSKHRPECPILAATSSQPVVRRLCMNWGVVPMLFQAGGTDDDKIAQCLEVAKGHHIVKQGDVVIATSGSTQETGGTNLIRVLTVS
jgi:pyruvate kinase